jgi:hypothetical protein
MLPEDITKLLTYGIRCIAVHRLDRNYNKRGIDPDYESEGEELLTPQVEHRLSQYSKDTLLTRAFLFIGIRLREASISRS